MSLLSVLKTFGKDVSHVGSWIDAGLKAVEPFVAIADPPLAPIVEAVEAVIERIQAATSTPLTSDMMQQIITSITTLEAVAPGTLAALKTAPIIAAVKVAA